MPFIFHSQPGNSTSVLQASWQSAHMVQPFLPMNCIGQFGQLWRSVVALQDLIGVPVLRTHGIYLALATFALGHVIAAIFLNLEVVGAAAGYPVSAYAPPMTIFICAAGVVALMVYISTTRFALYLTAIKNDPTVADLLGISVRSMQVSAFAIGAAVAGFGGALYAHHYNFIEAQHFDVALSVFTVLYV